MHKEVEKYLRVKRKLIVLEYARVFGSNNNFSRNYKYTTKVYRIMLTEDLILRINQSRCLNLTIYNPHKNENHENNPHHTSLLPNAGPRCTGCASRELGN